MQTGVTNDESRNEDHPHVTLCAICQSEKVRDVKWDVRRCKLEICNQTSSEPDVAQIAFICST